MYQITNVGNNLIQIDVIKEGKLRNIFIPVDGKNESEKITDAMRQMVSDRLIKIVPKATA